MCVYKSAVHVRVSILKLFRKNKWCDVTVVGRI